MLPLAFFNLLTRRTTRSATPSAAANANCNSSVPLVSQTPFVQTQLGGFALREKNRIAIFWCAQKLCRVTRGNHKARPKGGKRLMQTENNAAKGSHSARQWLCSFRGFSGYLLSIESFHYSYLNETRVYFCPRTCCKPVKQHRIVHGSWFPGQKHHQSTRNAPKLLTTHFLTLKPGKTSRYLSGETLEVF